MGREERRPFPPMAVCPLLPAQGPRCAVDSINLNKLERITALNDDELLEAAATVMDEPRLRGLLFAAIAAIVD